MRSAPLATLVGRPLPSKVLQAELGARAKRAQRKALKQVHVELSPKLNKKFRKSEHTGIRAFLSEQNAGE